VKQALLRFTLNGMAGFFVACLWSTVVLAGGSFSFPLFYESSSLDPVKDQLVSTYHVVGQVYDGLVAFDSNLGIMPGLAETWKVSRDGRQYDFTLRQGVRFHNGKEVTAQDAAASLSRLMRPENETSSKEFLYRIRGAVEFRDGQAEDVSGIRVLSDRRLIIELIEPYAPFLSVLAMPVAKIVPLEMIEDPDQPLTRHPVGTGPFRFVSWEGDTILLKGNRDYFRGGPRLEEIRFIYYTGEKRNRVFQDFLAGRLSGCPLPENADLAELKKQNYQIFIRPQLAFMFYGMNVAAPPLDDPHLRKALSYAFDRKRYTQEVLDSRHFPANQIIPPGMPGYCPENAMAVFDQEKAVWHLDQSRYPGGQGLPELVLASVSHSEAAKGELEMFRQNLAAIGITLKPLFVENWDEFKRGLEEGRYPLYRYAIYADVPDPDDLISDIVKTGGSHNFTGYSNPQVDEWIREGLSETNLKKRMGIYHEVERQVLEDQPLIPVIFISTQVVFQPDVKNIDLPATGTPYLPFSLMAVGDSP